MVFRDKVLGKGRWTSVVPQSSPWWNPREEENDKEKKIEEVDNRNTIEPYITKNTSATMKNAVKIVNKSVNKMLLCNSQNKGI